MMPEGVGSGVPLVYSKLPPGSSTGCSPTTPGPRTRLSDPPPGYLVGDGVTASVQTEKKAWYSRLLGN